MPDTIELVVSVDQAKEYIGEKRNNLVDVIAGRMDFVLNSFAERVKGNLSGGVLQTRSGALLGSVRKEPAQVSGDEVVGAVTAGGDEAPYGIYFEEGGTSEYEIVPINARVLAWMGEGRMMFAKRVIHPPTPHLPWFGIERQTAEEEMEREMNAAISEVLET